MSRNLHEVEIGIKITDENSIDGVSFLQGTSAPDGVSGKQGEAALSSLYFRRGTSEIYKKIANAGAPADYELLETSGAAVGNFRPEKVIATTSEVVGNGVRDLVANPFTDDEGTTLVAADFQVGEFIIDDSAGSPVLREISVVSAPNITLITPTAAPALATDDTFMSRNYLPDTPDTQEGQALIIFNGSIIVKIADIDWNFADGIQLKAGYAAASGDVTSADTVQSALQKVDGNNDAQDTLLGTSQGDTDLGTFAGSTIVDNSTVKAALTSMESAHEEVDANVDDLITLSGMPENSTDFGSFTGSTLTVGSNAKSLFQQLETKDEAQDIIVTEIDGNVDDLISLSGVAENSTNLGAFANFGAILFTATETVKSSLQKLADFVGNLRSVEVTGVTASAPIDLVPVATVYACKWLVTAFEEATPTNRKAFEVFALNDGSASDDTVYAKLKLGANFDVTIGTDVSGGNMRLLASSSTAGITVRARRIAVEDI